MKKTILFLFSGSCFKLPPFLTIINSLKDKYHILVISIETNDNRAKLQEIYNYSEVEFLNTCSFEQLMSFTERFKRRLHLKSLFCKVSEQLVEQTIYNVLWVIHENTLYDFRKFLRGKKYIASIYELNDHKPDFLQKIKGVVSQAQKVIVPEYNRACILRVWFKLNKTPLVLPNKPYNQPIIKDLDSPYSEQLKGKKIILYQGLITRSRNLDKLCEAVASLEGYTLILMGDKTEYRDYLQKSYSQIMCIDFVNPPAHLKITSYSYIGVVKYDYVFLNALYCAPNKTWEYCGFGIPILANNIPGLEYTVGKFNAGICTNMDNIEDIKNAIVKISDNYEYYSRNALEYFNSFDVKSFINNVVEKY